MKFDRQYKLSMEVAKGQVIHVELPFTVEFTIVRNTLGTSQTATFTLYNLKESLRELIYKDRYNTTQRRIVQFYAGYNGQTPLVFDGTIFEAYSIRQGVDFKTVLECQDGAFAMLNAFSNITIGTRAKVSDVLINLTKDLALVGINSQPIVGDYSSRFVRGSVYLGNTWSYLVQLTNRLAYIDNNRFVAIRANEGLESAQLPLITSESGLLGTPKRTETTVTFPMLFEPRLTAGQIVQLQSVGNSMFNGTYKVSGFKHQGIISPSVSGTATTDVQLWKGTDAFSTVPGVTV